MGLAADTSLKIQVEIDGIPDTLTCAKVAGRIRTPADGLTAAFAKAPTIGSTDGCADAVAGFDHITTSGDWSFHLDSTGTRGNVTMPAGGAVIRPNYLNGCVITMSPGSPTKLGGAYNGSDTFTLDKASVPLSGKGCTAEQPASISGELVLTPGVRVEP